MSHVIYYYICHNSCNHIYIVIVIGDNITNVVTAFYILLKDMLILYGIMVGIVQLDLH